MINNELEPNKAYFTSGEVRDILKITKSQLQTLMRPVKSAGKMLPPVFVPESMLNKVVPNRVLFTQKDLIRLGRYFRAYKEFYAAKAALRTSSDKLRGEPDVELD